VGKCAEIDLRNKNAQIDYNYREECDKNEQIWKLIRHHQILIWKFIGQIIVVAAMLIM